MPLLLIPAVLDGAAPGGPVFARPVFDCGGEDRQGPQDHVLAGGQGDAEVARGFGSAFSGLYFGPRSPVLGALDTAAGLLATACSVRTTARLDRTAMLALALRLAWLGYATYVSIATAAANPDSLFKPARHAAKGSR